MSEPIRKAGNTCLSAGRQSLQLFAEATVKIRHAIDTLIKICFEYKKARCRVSTLAVAAAVSVATGPAGATTLYMLDGPTHMTSVSGSTSSLSKVLGGTKDYKAIHRISNWESGNHPCKVKIKMRHLNKYTATSETETLDSGCDNDKISVGYSDTETYISGIQVCINNHKIKGLRVWGSELNRHTGGLSNVGRQEDKRSNCNNNWKAKYVCPAGEIATQVIMPYGLKDFVGAALVCREIVAQ